MLFFDRVSGQGGLGCRKVGPCSGRAGDYQSSKETQKYCVALSSGTKAPFAKSMGRLSQYLFSRHLSSPVPVPVPTLVPNPNVAFGEVL
jgi:hypothetical protein